MQKSLILLKPDCLGGKIVGETLARFERVGYDIVACKMIQLDSAVLNEHYSHVADLPFFPDIAAFMSSRPVIALILQGDNVVEGVRNLLGPTDSTQAPEGTIRGDLGTDKMRNVVHASDSAQSAKVEIDRFFSSAEIFEIA